MAADNLEQIRAVFLQARALPQADRPAFLDRACGADPAFRKEVERLLAADSPQTLAPTAGTTKTPNPSDSASLWAPPQIQIAGYQLIREISRGGQAVVCEAIQNSTGRKVAIKIMREGPLASARERARFDREMQVLAALNHPNIVRVVDRGRSSDGSYFLAMDYVGGPPLDEWLASYYRAHPEGPPPSDPSELLRLFLKICDAISAAHLRGIVHRDLKPSNIRIDENGEPVILDFSLARTAITSMTDEQTPQPVSITGQFLGSLPWASPEQAEGLPEKIDVRSDVYSLGVILYQMLTGRFPYQVAGTMRDVLNTIITANPSPPSQILAASEAREAQRRLRKHRHPIKSLNPTIDAIVMKTLTKRREDRYQSAGELARDLGNYLSGRPTIAGGEIRPPRSHKALPVAIAALFAALVTGGVTAWWIHAHNKGGGLIAATQPAISSVPAALRAPADDKRIIAAAAAAAKPAAPTPTPAPPATRPAPPIAVTPTTLPWPAANAKAADSLDQYSHLDAAGYRVVNLMPLIDPARDARSGTWKMENGGLSASSGDSQASDFRILAIPYEPPAEYDFRIEFTRTAGAGDVQQLRSHDAVRFSYAMDAFEEKHLFGFDFHAVGEGNEGAGPDMVAHPPLENGTKHVAVVSIRGGAMSATLDGKAAVKFATDYSEIKPRKTWDLGTAELGLGSWNSDVTFHSIEVTEISGRGIAGLQTMVPGALVTNPTPIKGLKNWTIETREHRGDITGVAYSPDGKILATGGNDGTLRLWDVATRELLRIFVYGDEYLEQLGWSPDGKLLASHSRLKTIVWEVASGKRVADSHIAGHPAWSPDGRRLAYEHPPGLIDLWETTTWRRVVQWQAVPHGSVVGLGWLQDNATIAVSTGENEFAGLYLYSVNTGRVETVSAKPEAYDDLKVSPDGKWIACDDRYSTVQVWDISKRAPIASRHGGVSKIAWSPTGNTLAVAWGEGCDEWNPATNITRHLDLTSPGGRPSAVAWSPDGRTVAVAKLHEGIDFIKTSDWTLNGKLSDEWNSDETAFAPDGSSMAVRASSNDKDCRIRLFTPAGQLVRETALQHDALDSRPALSADGGTLSLTGRDQMILFDCRSGAMLGKLGGDNNDKAAWRPHSTVFATTWGDQLKLWDSANRKLLKTTKATSNIEQMAWSPDGRVIAVIVNDHKLIELRDADGNLTRSIETPAAYDVFWSPDGTVLASSGEQHTSTWDPKTGKLNWMIDAFEGRHFSPDGTHMDGFRERVGNIAAAYVEHVVANANDGKVVCGMAIENEWINGRSAWLSPDLLAVTADTNSVRYWNPRTGKPLGVLLTALPGSQVAKIDPDGHVHCTGGAEKSLLYITQTDAGQETLTPEQFRAKYGWKD